MPLIIPSNTITGGYEVANSLRFDDGSSDYLTKTFGSVGNRKTWTWSGWIKRCFLGTQQDFFSVSSGASTFHVLYFDSNDQLTYNYNSSNIINTTRVFRDVSAWYHVVIAQDTTQATSSDRVKVWVNGVQETVFDSSTYPSLNADLGINNNVRHDISNQGAYYNNNSYFDGYMAEVVFIDGQQLDPTSFGEFDEDSGIWKPIDVSGLTFGTNGFYLDFENSGSLGADVSGNGNNFTVNNLTSDDQVLDTPTNNFAVLDSTFSRINQNLTYSQGNLRAYNPSGTVNQNAVCTFPFQNITNIYYEGYCVSTGTDPSNTRLQASFTIDNDFAILAYRANGAITLNNSTVTTVSSFTGGDIISMLSSSSGNVYFYKNNILQYTYSGTTLTGYIKLLPRLSDNGGEWVVNFGQDSSFGGILTKQNNTDINGIGDFYYSTASSGQACCTKNIANQSPPILDKPSDYFNTVLYTGTGATQSITGVGFQPDFTWIKQRDGATPRHHRLVDSVRGATKYLESDRNIAEVTDSNQVTSLDSDGFTVGTGNATNSNTVNFVSWNWKAGGTAVTNTDGSITSSVSANTTSRFSIVSYTGTGANATVGHGLGVAPKMIIVKNRDRSAAGAWQVYHASIGATQTLELNDTTGAYSSSTRWNDTEPTSSVFSIGSSLEVNGSGENIIAYCFSEVFGFSQIDAQRGNSSTDGVQFDVGFRPAWIIIKGDNTSNWIIHDVKRDITNPLNARLFANSDVAEDTTIEIGDITNTGFKARTTNSDYNSNGVFYYFLAIAEANIVNSNGIPLTAR